MGSDDAGMRHLSRDAGGIHAGEGGMSESVIESAFVFVALIVVFFSLI